MKENEFIKTISDEKVIVSLDKYEQLIVNTTKLSLIKTLFEKDSRTYGLTDETTKTVEGILGIERGAKNDTV